MKITLRSANLIDLVTSQGRVRFLATHTQAILEIPEFWKTKKLSIFRFFLDNRSKFTEVLFTT